MDEDGEVGRRKAEIKKSGDSESNIWIVVGIAGAFFVVAILTGIIYIARSMHKNRQKNEGHKQDVNTLKVR